MKVVLLFLLAMVLVAMVGRALFPGALRVRRVSSRRPKTCPDCGRYRIGSSPCDCGGRGRKRG